MVNASRVLTLRGDGGDTEVPIHFRARAARRLLVLPLRSRMA
jgi:hypothetical protein